MNRLHHQLQPLVLASASPRRVQLLEQIGVEFTQSPANIDEAVLANETAQDYVTRLAREKSFIIALERPGQHVLGSDTTVYCGTKILGKPTDLDDYMTMMALLSGSTHQVITAVCIAQLGASGLTFKEQCVRSDVSFVTLSEAQKIAYWETGEPIGKAGGYAIQGIGGQFVSQINGSYSAIVGLPLQQTVMCLQQSGVIK